MLIADSWFFSAILAESPRPLQKSRFFLPQRITAETLHPYFTIINKYKTGLFVRRSLR